MNTLNPLPHPVYFVCKDKQRWGDLMGLDDLPDDMSPLFARSISASDIWSPQTYLHLKQRGLNVHLVPAHVPGKICIFTYDQISFKTLAFNSYVVVCRHDRARPELCEQRIVLNKLNVIDHTDHFVPHWPQPNLKPRDRSRGTTVKNLVFKGLLRNLAYPFQAPEFIQAIRDLGVEFRYGTEETKTLFDDWADYTQADVVIAVRNNTAYDLTLKPPLKLINAWFAGCPAILGPEPAYQDLRQSELDYIEVRSPAEAIEAVRRLKEEPGLYSAMVENGRLRSKEFTSDATARIWRDILAGPIADGYNRWKRQNPLQKLIGRPIQYGLRALKHQREHRYYRKHIHAGPRLFPNEAVRQG